MLSSQLVPYWEKTFDIDLSAPQIGVVNVTDVSLLPSPTLPPSPARTPCSADWALNPAQRNEMPLGSWLGEVGEALALNTLLLELAWHPQGPGHILSSP